MSLKGSAPRQRRRGAALEEALLDAAWQELAENGYDQLTIEGVAARAGTSRPVIYRRWPGKPELARAAIAHSIRTVPVSIPDTGTVRDDLIALLTSMNRRRVGVATLLSARLGEFYRETGTTLADLRELILDGRPNSADIIIQRGIERGEIDPAKLTPRIARLPADLVRLELLMTFKPMDPEDIEEIIDMIFLPLTRTAPPIG